MTKFNIDELNRILLGCSSESLEEGNGSMLSPLTATQKTHNTTQYTQRRVEGGGGGYNGSGGELRAATEALMLIRWIGEEGVKVLMRQNKLARVVFGIMIPGDEGGEDELLEQYVVRVCHFI